MVFFNLIYLGLFMKQLLFSLFFITLFSFNAIASAECPSQCLSEECQSQCSSEKICSPTECYSIVKQIGEGFFGKVYAVENSQGLPFAIKIYKIDLENIFTDAEREFSRGQMLNHPHIIKSYDYFTSDSNCNSKGGSANIVLDLVNGKNLNEVENGEIKGSQLSETLGQFVDALRHAYSIDLMHIDLHRGNVMLDHDTSIKIIDLASFFTLDELMGSVMNKELSNANSKEEKNSLSRETNLLFEKNEILSLEPAKMGKLEKFFNEHPDLLKQMQANLVKKKGLLSKKDSTETQAIDILSIDDVPIEFPVQSYYLEQITDICLALISHSDAPRQEKIEMRANIKKVVWNYEEDVKEGINLPFLTYLDQLFHVFQT